MELRQERQPFPQAEQEAPPSWKYPREQAWQLVDDPLHWVHLLSQDRQVEVDKKKPRTQLSHEDATPLQLRQGC